MGEADKTKEEKLAKLEETLKALKSSLPEHCGGGEAYVGTHRASPELWQEIEDAEDEIKKLKEDLGQGT